MLRYMRKYHTTLTRSVILLFLLSGNVGAWASNISNVKTAAPKSHCHEMDAYAQMQHAAPLASSNIQQHDCCKKTDTCNKLCCNLCLVGGVAGVALFASMDIQFDYRSTEFSSLSVTLPDGVLSSTPYRPPQFLLN